MKKKQPKRIIFQATSNFHNLIRRAAKRKGLNMSALIRLALKKEISGE